MKNILPIIIFIIFLFFVGEIISKKYFKVETKALTIFEIKGYNLSKRELKDIQKMLPDRAIIQKINKVKSNLIWITYKQGKHQYRLSIKISLFSMTMLTETRI